VARAAVTRNVPFYCFKGISDGYTDRLPDFSRFINSNGELRMGAFLAHAALRPQYWSSLLRLGRNSKEAASALAQLIKQTLPKSL
jgi:adenosylhomocysteine nucleosidase